MESPQHLVSATRGSSVTLPCHYRYEPELTAPRRTRVKWSWLPASSITTNEAFALETEVMVAMGNRHRSYGSFKGRVRLRRSAPGDMSLVINELQLNDTGRYRCEVIDGLEDESVTVELELRGEIHLSLMYFIEVNTKQRLTVKECLSVTGLLTDRTSIWRSVGANN